jgi:hypothetical protein
LTPLTDRICLIAHRPVSIARTDANQVQNGGTPFFELVRQTVRKLDDFDSLVPVLQAAGKVQRKYDTSRGWL